MIETERGQTDKDIETKTVKIDSSKDIVAISMKMYEGEVCGLRLIADDFTYVFDETWYTYKNRGEWQTQDLSDDEQILGIAANKESDGTTLKIAWILGSAFEQG